MTVTLGALVPFCEEGDTGFFSVGEVLATDPS